MNTLPPLSVLDRMSPDELGRAMVNHVDSPEQIRFLLDLGANPCVTLSECLVDYVYVYSILHRAAGRGHLDVCKVLIDAGAEVNSRSQNGLTPLHGAAYHGHLDVVKFLVSQGADVNLRDKFGRTALRQGRINRQDEVVMYLKSLEFSTP